MNESNTIKTIYWTNLTNQTKFQLSEISKIEKYFNTEINQGKLGSKKLSKYVAAFDYTNKILIVLYRESGRDSIISLQLLLELLYE